jgi:hypothetical protein
MPVDLVDLCCGSGRALIEAASQVPEIIGVDLVDFFAGPVPANLRLIAAQAGEWTPSTAREQCSLRRQR